MHWPVFDGFCKIKIDEIEIVKYFNFQLHILLDNHNMFLFI